MRTHFRWAALAAVIPVALVFAGCDKTVDSGDLESKIGDNIKQQIGQKVKVDCPGDIKAKKGTVVNCTVTLANGKKVKAVATMKDGDGNFSYTVPQQ